MWGRWTRPGLRTESGVCPDGRAARPYLVIVRICPSRWPEKAAVCHAKPIDSLFIHCISMHLMKVTAQLWGNSLGIRIPAPVAREINLSHGSEIDLQIEKGRIVLTPVRKRSHPDLKALLSKITTGNIPEGDVWGLPVGKEVW